jgi:hypothetical protein
MARGNVKGILKRATRIQTTTGMSSHDALGLAVKRAKVYRTRGSTAAVISRGVAKGTITPGQGKKAKATLMRHDAQSPFKGVLGGGGIYQSRVMSGRAKPSGINKTANAREVVSTAKMLRDWAADKKQRKANATTTTSAQQTSVTPNPTAMSQQTIDAMRGRGTGRNRSGGR